MIKKASHIILALILMVSTMGMTVSMHYCGQQLIDFGVLSQAENCCGDVHIAKTTATDQHCAFNMPEDNHCQDETLHFEPVDEYVGATAICTLDIHPVVQHLLIPPTFTLVANKSEDLGNEYFQWSASPPTTSHFLSLIQTYLI